MSLRSLREHRITESLKLYPEGQLSGQLIDILVDLFFHAIDNKIDLQKLFDAANLEFCNERKWNTKRNPYERK